MSLFDNLFLLAQSSAEQTSSGGIFSVPNFFFALIGACILMIIVGAICDHRAAQDEEDEDLEDTPGGETDAGEFADEAVGAEAQTKEEKKRAKQEAKEKKKQEQAEKKQAKAAAKQAKAAAKQAKKKKGKGA